MGGFPKEERWPEYNPERQGRIPKIETKHLARIKTKLGSNQVSPMGTKKVPKEERVARIQIQNVKENTKKTN